MRPLVTHPTNLPSRKVWAATAGAIISAAVVQGLQDWLGSEVAPAYQALITMLSAGLGALAFGWLKREGAM